MERDSSSGFDGGRCGGGAFVADDPLPVWFTRCKIALAHARCCWIYMIRLRLGGVSSMARFRAATCCLLIGWRLRVKALLIWARGLRKDSVALAITAPTLWSTPSDSRARSLGA